MYYLFFLGGGSRDFSSTWVYLGVNDVLEVAHNRLRKEPWLVITVQLMVLNSSLDIYL